jgi:hypothetical protein
MDLLYLFTSNDWCGKHKKCKEMYYISPPYLVASLFELWSWMLWQSCFRFIFERYPVYISWQFYLTSVMFSWFSSFATEKFWKCEPCMKAYSLNNVTAQILPVLKLQISIMCTSHTAICSWLRCYAANQKIAGYWIFFNLPIPFQPHYGPGVYSASNRIEYQKTFLEYKAWLLCKADSLTTICESIM